MHVSSGSVVHQSSLVLRADARRTSVEFLAPFSGMNNPADAPWRKQAGDAGNADTVGGLIVAFVLVGFFGALMCLLPLKRLYMSLGPPPQADGKRRYPLRPLLQ